MHFGLSEEYSALRETVRAFANDKVAPVIGARCEGETS